MRYALALLALFVAATMLSGCGGDDESVAVRGGSAGAGALAEEYVSVEVLEDGAPRRLVPDTVIVMRFDGADLRAALGCNQLGARYELDGDRLVVDEVSMTEMGCEPERNAQDAWFVDLLTARPTVEVDGDRLTLTAGRTVVVLVDREVAEPDRDLVGTTWEVDGFADGLGPDDAAMSFAVDQPGVVRLLEDGFVTGGDGCNGFGHGAPEADAQVGLQYELDGDRVRFVGNPPHTLVACPADLEEYVDRFWAALSGTATWSIDADRLTLVGADGRVVTFRAAD